MRKFLLLFSVLLAPLSSSWAATVTGTIRSVSSSAPTNVSIRFTLKNCGANAPKIAGTATVNVAPVTVKPNSTTGAYSLTLYRNDTEIQCGNTYPTYYLREVLNGSTVTSSDSYRIEAETVNIDNVVPLTSFAIAPPLTLANVAMSGSYNDLKDKPTIPAAQVQTDWNAATGMALILNKPALATVATTGSYSDLTNKPTIPAAQVQTDWNAATGMGVLLNKPSTFTPSAHTHTKANISDFPTAWPWGSLTGVPSTFTPSAHTHLWADTTDKPATFTPSAHTHVKANITDFPVMAANTTCSGSDKISAYNSTTGAFTCSADQTGTGGSGITTLNTLTASTQSFAIGTSGTSPGWSSATSTHTLNIPVASAASVTAGLISKTDYDNFTAARTGQITFLAGCDTCSALADTDDQASIFVNRLGRSVTISEVFCESDAGTPIIQLQKDDGTPTNMLSSNLTCSASGASTTTFVSGENVLANTNRLDFTTVTAGGTAKRVTVVVKYQ